MRQLRSIRILLATLLFVAAVAYLFIGPKAHPMAVVSVKSQIIPSAIAISIGAVIFWLIVSFFFGRLYCATACPIGSLIDIITPLRRKIPSLNRPFSYRKKRSFRYQMLGLYILCLILGITVVPLLIEPWNIMRNIASTVNLSASAESWLDLGLGVSTGIIAGIVSLLLIIFSALRYGRIFCSEICPVGTALSLLNDFSTFHIEINPDKCISCMECEDNCPASCIKIVGRYVDNSRCVRCFDCVARCPNDAIRYQSRRNRPASALMRKVKSRQP